MIIETKDKLTYHVQSESKPGAHHLVDLDANNGNGECSCEDFTCRKMIKLKETGKIVMYGQPQSTRCKHIHGCLAHLGSTVMDRMKGRA